VGNDYGELDHAMQELARRLAHFLPRVLAMLIHCAFGLDGCLRFQSRLRGILRVVKFDRLADNAGTTDC